MLVSVNGAGMYPRECASPRVRWKWIFRKARRLQCFGAASDLCHSGQRASCSGVAAGLAEVLLLSGFGYGCQFALQKWAQVSHCWVAPIETEQPQIADPSAHQHACSSRRLCWRWVRSSPKLNAVAMRRAFPSKYH